MIEPFKPLFLLLIASATTLTGCGNTDNSTPAARDTATPAGTATSQLEAPATAPVEIVSRERVLRAMKCHIVLSQSVGTKMANADTGLPPELASRLKASSVARWHTFSEAHAQAAGVQENDRATIVTQLNALSSGADDRQQTIDTVRDCLDNEP